MLSAKLSTFPAALDLESPVTHVTSTPIVDRKRPDRERIAAASPTVVSPLGGTPIKRRNEQRDELIRAEQGTQTAASPVPSSSAVATKDTHSHAVQTEPAEREPDRVLAPATLNKGSRVAIITSNSKGAVSSSPGPVSSAKVTSPVSSLHTDDLKEGIEDIEAEIFIDNDDEAEEDLDSDLPLPPPPPVPPAPSFCAITMTPKSTRKIADAASFLQRETEKYGVDATKENVVMKSANSMSLKMRDIADFFHFSHQHLRSRPASSSGGSEGRNNALSADDGENDEEEEVEPAIRSKEDLLAAARSISADGDNVVRFAKTIARLCADHATSKVR